MKNIYFIAIALIVISLFWSCQDEPAFPDPGFELEDQDVEVRRDTADVYAVSMKMEVPNGVDYIEVLNATNYELIETVTSYEGQKNFTFNYDIDLRPYEQDTTLYYIFKVMDKDQRSTNRGFTLNVKRFSFPEILLVGGTNLNVVVPIYQLKGLVSTGLNELESVQVLFKGEEHFSYIVPSDTAIYEYVLSEVIGFGALLTGEEYNLDIIIKDRKGQTSTTNIIVRKSEGLRLPKGIGVYNSHYKINSYVDLGYDELNRINEITYSFESTGSVRNYRLTYNEMGCVDTLSYLTRVNESTSTAGTQYNSQIYMYKEGSKQLDQIVRYDVVYYDNGSFEILTDHEVESRDFKYDDRGGIISYFGKTETINIEYTDPFGTGESVLAEYFQNYRYNELVEKYRQRRTSFEPVYMPSYIDGLPPFNTVFSLRHLFNDLFLDKYVVTKTEVINPEVADALEQPWYTYETDADGNVITYTRNLLYNGWQARSYVYTFHY